MERIRNGKGDNTIVNRSVKTSVGKGSVKEGRWEKGRKSDYYISDIFMLFSFPGNTRAKGQLVINIAVGYLRG